MRKHKKRIINRNDFWHTSIERVGWTLTIWEFVMACLKDNTVAWSVSQCVCVYVGKFSAVYTMSILCGTQIWNKTTSSETRKFSTHSLSFTHTHTLSVCVCLQVRIICIATMNWLRSEVERIAMHVRLQRANNVPTKSHPKTFEKVCANS